jgi:large subunit ribosomal protein L9e
MLQIYKELDLEIPSGIEVKVDSRVISVKGPRGELSKVSICRELKKG